MSVGGFGGVDVCFGVGVGVGFGEGLDAAFSAKNILPSLRGWTPGEEVTPKNVLLIHHEDLTNNDIYFFIIQYVLQKYDVQLQSVECAVTEMVIRNLMPSDSNHFS